MPSEISWYIPKRVIAIREYGDVTLEDLTKGAVIVDRYLAQAEGEKIHYLIDQSEMVSTVFNFEELKKTLSNMRDPHIGWMVMYRPQANAFLTFVMTVVSQFFGVKLRQVTSRTEAINFLVNVDPTLKELLPAEDVNSVHVG